MVLAGSAVVLVGRSLPENRTFLLDLRSLGVAEEDASGAFDLIGDMASAFRLAISDCVDWTDVVVFGGVGDR